MSEGKVSGVQQANRLLALVGLMSVVGTLWGGPWDKAYLQGTTEKSPCSYKAGETMVFNFEIRDLPSEVVTEGYKLAYKRTGDDGKRDQGLVPFAREGMKVVTSIGKPGFVEIEAWVEDAEGKVVRREEKGPRNCVGTEDIRFVGGAGADVAKLEPGLAEPKDFGAKWKGALAKLKKGKPIDFKHLSAYLKDVGEGRNFHCYELAIPCYGPNYSDCYMTAHLSYPKNAEPKSLKAQIDFDGYGVYRQGAPGWCDGKAIYLHVNAHGLYPLEMTQEQFDTFRKERIENRGGYGFNDEDNEVFERTYFFGMAMRAVQATTFMREFVKTRPEWDGKTLMIHGGSQGALQSCWAAALVKGVTDLRIHVPWFCDLGGIAVGRQGGWRPAMRAALPYYDPVNMAHHMPASIRKEIYRSGLGDGIARPSSHAVLFNAMKGRKSLRFRQGGNHYDDHPGAVQEDVMKH